MPRARGLGPRGHAAVQVAAQQLSAAPVTDPNDVLVNPANVVVDEPLPEQETLPERFIPMDSSRMQEAGYDAGSQRLYVIWQKPSNSHPDGTWTYHSVPPNVWKNLQRSASPGKFVNRVLNKYRYNPGEWTP